MDAETGVHTALLLRQGKRRACPGDARRDVHYLRDAGRTRTGEHLGGIVTEVRVGVDHAASAVSIRGKSGVAGAMRAGSSLPAATRSQAVSPGWPSASRILGAVSGK